MATRGWQDVTQSDITRMQQKSTPSAKPSKYKNVKIQIDGFTFDSKREAQHWAELKLRAKAGDINSLNRQVPFALCCPVESSAMEARAIVSTYIADFSYYDRDGVRHIVDAKGKRTALYQLKKKWLELQTGIVIEEV